MEVTGTHLCKDFSPIQGVYLWDNPQRGWSQVLPPHREVADDQGWSAVPTNSGSLIQKSRRRDRSAGLNTTGWGLGEYLGTNSPALSEMQAECLWFGRVRQFFEIRESFRLELSGAFLIRVTREERGQKRTRQYRCENLIATKVAHGNTLTSGVQLWRGVKR